MNSEISDGVAEDFRQALLDLTMNSRYEISNLTVIARENTEHAYAISEALKHHIKQVGLDFYSAFGTFFRSNVPCFVFVSAMSHISFKCFRTAAYTSPDPSSEETSGLLRPRLRGKKCRDAIHNFSVSRALHNLHGSLRSCGYECSTEDG
jgi:hypothetical protein